MWKPKSKTGELSFFFPSRMKLGSYNLRRAPSSPTHPKPSVYWGDGSVANIGLTYWKSSSVFFFCPTFSLLPCPISVLLYLLICFFELTYPASSGLAPLDFKETSKLLMVLCSLFLIFHAAIFTHTFFLFFRSSAVTNAGHLKVLLNGEHRGTP